VLDRINSAHLPQENEMLEAFRSRGVIRVTTFHAKKPFIVETVEEALKQIRREELSLGDLLLPGPKKPKSRRLDRWADRNFDDTTLDELSRLTNTTIVRGPKKTVSTMNVLFESSNDSRLRFLVFITDQTL